MATVRELIDETPRCRSIRLEPAEWPGHRAGQHLDVRLTAEDGYQAQRSYSIASAPEDEGLVLTVERLEDGEVSPYLVDELRPGDELELRGPIGGYFVWEDSAAGPVMLVAGGSGIVPFRAMLRHRAAADRGVVPRLLYSSRSVADLIYREELTDLAASQGVDISFTLTREAPEAWPGHHGRVDRRLLADVAWPSQDRPLVFVCGPSAFVETVAQGLVANGHAPDRIRTERFGPTGT
ncbi:MAG TPA: ferredoxin reductase [Solirubrobacteraceae bacterium]|jgi:ferredoxin-NADP reductase|nr:ferredoxin reductase [Solirubrobacteraceae bacterium]